MEKVVVEKRKRRRKMLKNPILNLKNPPRKILGKALSKLMLL